MPTPGAAGTREPVGQHPAFEVSAKLPFHVHLHPSVLAVAARCKPEVSRCCWTIRWRIVVSGLWRS